MEARKEIVENHGKFVKLDGHRPHEVTEVLKNRDGTEAERYGLLWYRMPPYAEYLQNKPGSAAMAIIIKGGGTC